MNPGWDDEDIWELGPDPEDEAWWAEQTHDDDQSDDWTEGDDSDADRRYDDMAEASRFLDGHEHGLKLV